MAKKWQKMAKNDKKLQTLKKIILPEKLGAFKHLTPSIVYEIETSSDEYYSVIIFFSKIKIKGTN